MFEEELDENGRMICVEERGSAHVPFDQSSQNGVGNDTRLTNSLSPPAHPVAMLYSMAGRFA
eukprot:2381438-Pyramimonas_sp.AAC.1